MTEIEKLRQIISESENIVFFGGAGVSTESGIPDFRSADGLYAQKYAYPPETIVSRNFFYENTEYFYNFYKEKMLNPAAMPSGAHIALAKLEKAGKLKAVITQNIDALHFAAGSRSVIELHGSVERNFCLKCGAAHSAAFVKNARGVPRCACGGLIKPDVVLYGENLNDADIFSAVDFIKNAETLIIGGTSLAVRPAAGLVDYFRGDNLVLINKTPTPADGRARLIIREPIGRALSAAV